MSTRLKIWGCRGSIATPGPDTFEYGGNTSCVEVALEDGSVVVLDAGSGIRPLGLELLARGTLHVDVFLTHLHLDHLEGLRFFAPLWDERVKLDIWGPGSPVASLRDRMLRAFSPPVFPVDLRDVPARVNFHDLPSEPWTAGPLSITADLVLHPGPTVGSRIETAKSSIAYLPDHEPALAGVTGRSRAWISGGALAREVDLLLHDAQYFEREYEDRVGWGHSSVADAVVFSRAVGARKLVLFHHEPAHSDRELERLEDRARDLARPAAALPTLAREGMAFDLA